MKVTIGEVNRVSTLSNASPNKYVVYAKMFKRHPNYVSSTRINNIMLIYLPSDSYWSLNAAVPALYLKDPQISTVYTASYLDQVVDVAGWGRTTTVVQSETLQTTKMKFIDAAACRTAFPGTSSKDLCLTSASTTVNQITCAYGDNGGPVYLGGALVGIISFSGWNCPETNVHVISIYAYFDYIVTNLKAANAGTIW